MKVTPEQLEIIIDKSIKKHVNGKIDKLHKKFDKHEEKMIPIFEAYSYANKTGKMIIGLSKIMLALGTIYGVIRGIIYWLKH